MSHLPNLGLKTWGKGDRLTAEQLNANFVALLGAIETCMHTALSPDPASVANEVAIAGHANRLNTLERMLQMHERQRNEKAWAPLSHVAALMQLMLEIRGPLDDRAGKLLAAQEEARGQHDNLARRLQRLEQQPEAAMAEDFRALAQEFQRIADKEHMLLAQVIGLRHEVMHLTNMAKGHARNRNEMEYAPLSTVGHLLQRIREIEARLPAGDAKVAAS
jgi:hypothetical protein